MKKQWQMLRISWGPGRKFKKALEMGVGKGGSLRLGLGVTGIWVTHPRGSEAKIQLPEEVRVRVW